ncbi:efflux RND transporter periplasmic adaptor subunit (plasmid) [Skermanella mucosa]|uniref:efflux RND transporter periplasmic adaptor subunit n=1 Tax=Skermanella mucosa TaxID=1789672 RepID=UPI00192C2DEB|nr:efflux RND transporter periplasmic adaptor subunit [Skermanella mucosa]UEM24704.1 efflux RND transporter periplasmic adaptor subunit [Skermanella mucosa]
MPEARDPEARSRRGKARAQARDAGEKRPAGGAPEPDTPAAGGGVRTGWMTVLRLPRFLRTEGKPVNRHGPRLLTVTSAPDTPGGDRWGSAEGGRDDGSGDGRHTPWKWWLLAAAILLAGIGAATLIYLLRSRPEPQPPPPEAPYVETVKARPGRSAITITGSGIVMPRAEVGLSAQVGGRVDHVHPELVSGGEFDRGEVLVRLEDADYRNQAQRAQATVARRQVELRQAQEEARIARQEYRLLRDRLGSEGGTAGGAPDVSPLTLGRPQLQAAQAALQAARAELADAELALARTTVEAPFDGYVRSEDVDVGQFVQPAQELARIYSAGEVEVTVPLLSDKASLIPNLWEMPAGDPGGAGGGGGRVPALVAIDYGGLRFGWDGYVDRTRAFIDERTRTIDVVVRVPDPRRPGRPIGTDGSEPLVSPPPLLVGSYATVEIEGRPPERYLTIPASALRRGDSVWALARADQPDRARLRIVEVDVILRDGDTVQVKADRLPDGVLLVTSTVEAPTDGMLVRTSAEADSAPRDDAPGTGTDTGTAE